MSSSETTTITMAGILVLATGLTVQGGLHRAQLQHVAQHGPTPLGRKLRGALQGQNQGLGVGVVGVVDDRRPTAQSMYGTAAGGRSEFGNGSRDTLHLVPHHPFDLAGTIRQGHI